MISMASFPYEYGRGYSSTAAKMEKWNSILEAKFSLNEEKKALAVQKFLNNTYLLQVLSDFDKNYYSTEVQEFISGFNSYKGDYSCVILFGKPGSGKTYLLKYLYFLAFAHGVRGCYYTAEFWDNIGLLEEKDFYLQLAQKPGIAFIDEIDAVSRRENIEYLRCVLKNRLQDADKLTLLASKEPGIELNGYLEQKFPEAESSSIKTIIM